MVESPNFNNKIYLFTIRGREKDPEIFVLVDLMNRTHVWSK